MKDAKKTYKNNWRQKSLEVLENQNWGNPKTAPTNLVRRCIELTKIPIESFTPGDLRVMIGQKIGLPFLIPIALEKLEENLFIDTEYYDGDLLSNVLNIDTSFWDNNEPLWTQLDRLIKNRQQELKDNKISTTAFDKAKFRHKKGSS